MRSIGCLLVVAACGSDAAVTAPVIEGSVPDHGPLGGGTRIVLLGSGFLSSDSVPNRVVIGGRQAPLTSAIDDSMLQVVIPPGERPGDAEVIVFNRNGHTIATDVFHYSTLPTIASITPRDVLFSATTTVTMTGTGFADESAGTPAVLVDGRPIEDVVVTSDTTLTFAAPPGTPLASPDIQLHNARGIATRARGFRYAPGTRGGLLLFPPSSSSFAVFLDPVDNSTIAIPRTNFGTRFTAVVRDTKLEYWGIDRSRRFGRIDMKTQTLEEPVFVQATIPAMLQKGGDYIALDRNGLRFGKLDPSTGAFEVLGSAVLPCCGSFGIASDGATIYFTSRAGTTTSINTLDATTGAIGTAVPLTATASFHVEDMRFFGGRLYASSRDGSLVTIDPATGIVTTLPLGLGRFTAIEVFD